MRAQGFPASVGFLDDLWVCPESEELAREALELLQDLSEFLGLDVAWDKCEGPVQDVVFLGVCMCTNEFGEGQVSASLPQKKCRALRDKAKFFAQTRWCARKDLERFMGQLAFASRLVRGLSLFCGSGHALLRSKQKWLQMTGGACADFRFVAECLDLYNGHQVVLVKRKVKPSHFSVDASTGTGMGGFLDGRYFAVSWPEILALPQEPFYPFKDDASSRINYLELFLVFSALKLWGEVLRGLTVVLITDNTPTKGMLEKWRCTPDFRKLLRAVFKQCVCFDVRFNVEWVPSKENQFADALSRKEMSLFFDLHREWKATSIWRQDKNDWKLFSEVFDRLDKRHFLECKRRQNLGTSVCFVIPVWPTPDFYKFVLDGPLVFLPVERLYLVTVPTLAKEEEKRELEDGSARYTVNAVAVNTRSAYETGVRNLHLDLCFTLPEFEDLPHLRRTLRGIKRLKGNPKRKKLGIGPKELVSIFFDGKANVTAKKEDAFSRSGVMLRGSVRFTGKDYMEVGASFSKTNQFAEREHKVFFQTVRYTAFCVVTLTRKALAANLLPGGPKAPLLCYRKADVDEYHDMSLEQRLAIPKLVSNSMAAAVDARC
ncbi:hypothetical protein CYMTET_55411 [Cymbomonas tetramitiformis]|uniref:Reverse transcriptase domain-containing protein n=1 Tax=Cymbomonas tetramitiformis TaxID=36881 RepID=A0AAE0BE52_9CHLO|nr:hypothetical protein CYMTET_55411 [Cymbomonas tetramitiformis]